MFSVCTQYTKFSPNQGELNTRRGQHELVYGESSSNAEMRQCLFIICVIVCNLYYCSPAVQIRHSKVYGNPIAPSLYSILIALN